MAKLLVNTFRSTDIIARIGGDEFVVLAIDAVLSDAEILTQHLKVNLNAYNARKQGRYKLSVSLGVANYNAVAPCPIDVLLKKADEKMYENKRRKKRERNKLLPKRIHKL